MNTLKKFRYYLIDGHDWWVVRMVGGLERWKGKLMAVLVEADV